jgi:hypothetical protein
MILSSQSHSIKNEKFLFTKADFEILSYVIPHHFFALSGSSIIHTIDVFLIMFQELMTQVFDCIVTHSSV